jgi:hypothetical protein
VRLETMPAQPADRRLTCSYCCKPFTDQNPGTLVKSNTYIMSLSAPVTDPNKPNCAVVRLAPDVVCCKDCCERWGYGAIEPVSEIKSRKPRGRRPKTDPKMDRQIAEAWKTGEHADHEQLARAFDMSKADARRALDRHRKRPN